MLQDSASPHSNDNKCAALADAAWALLATHDIDKIGLDMVADMAGIEHGLAGALEGSVQRLVLAKMAALDHQSVMESTFSSFTALVTWPSILMRANFNGKKIFRTNMVNFIFYGLFQLVQYFTMEK